MFRRLGRTLERSVIEETLKIEESYLITVTTTTVGNGNKQFLSFIQMYVLLAPRGVL